MIAGRLIEGFLRIPRWTLALAAGLAALVPVVAATLSVGAAADTGPVRFAPPERAAATTRSRSS